MFQHSSVTAVLFITLSERIDFKDPRLAWRTSTEELTNVRFRVLMRSLRRYFALQDFAEFIIVCPFSDLRTLSELANTWDHHPHLRFITDDAVCSSLTYNEHAELSHASGWLRQQILKILVAQHVHTTHYLTLDSDLICRRVSGLSDLLLPSGRALVNTEMQKDYYSLYVDAFADLEFARKTLRYRGAAKVLHYDRGNSLRWHFYGETPTMLKTHLVEALIMHLQGVSDDSWIFTLMHTSNWSEYSLYFQYIEMTDQLESHYHLVGADHILDLSRSIWHPSDVYRKERTYSVGGLLSDCSANEGGIFVAIQSWLPIRAWLPNTFSSSIEFYHALDAALNETL